VPLSGIDALLGHALKALEKTSVHCLKLGLKVVDVPFACMFDGNKQKAG
jgi:hypothetical protein